MKNRIEYLFIQYFNGKSTKIELNEFFDLLNSAEEDEKIVNLIEIVYEEIQCNFSSLTSINNEGELVVNKDTTPYENKKAKSTFSKKKVFSLVALLFFLIMPPIALWFSKNNLLDEDKNFTIVKQFTHGGEHKYLILEDGTQVWLNANSTLSYPEKFDSNRREVFLSGEAFFDVKHAEKIPFYIHSGDVVTKVLGTSFNIKAYPNQQNISVTVKRGKVEVLKTNKVLAILTKGEKVRINKKIDDSIDTITNYKIEEELTEEKNVGAWQRGYFIYRDELFTDIISDMEQIFNTKITVENQHLNTIFVTTSFNRDIGLQQALSILCKLIDAHLVIGDNTYHIKNK